MRYISPAHNPRLAMEMIGELHERGYGRLKLFCYIKEGLGVWRSFLFVGDNFPDRISELPRPILDGTRYWLSVPADEGSSARDAADDFVKTQHEFLSTAIGKDDIYVNWYSNMLRLYKNGVLEMESPFVAKINYKEIDTPYKSKSQS
jgi:hypothetical protein